MIMSKDEDRRCRQVAELFRPFLEETGDWCVVRSEQFGYIVLSYYVNGRFEDNNIFDNAKDLFDFLLDHWRFRWLYLKSKENEVAEYEDYEKNLTKEQREEREKTLLEYKNVFEDIKRQKCSEFCQII